MSDHINVFEPFSSLPLDHENALTRALMIVLRTVPMAHAAFLDLVAEQHAAAVARWGDALGPRIAGIHDLPGADFATQRATLPAADDPPSRLVSVVITPEPRFVQERAVTTGRRDGIPDMFVVYGAALALQLESKRFPNSVDAGQLDIHDANAPDGTGVDPVLVALTWEDVFAAWWSLRQRNLLGAGERVVFDDFLDYVDEHHEALRPYKTVEMCDDDIDLLARRCRSALETIGGADRTRDDGYFWGANLSLGGDWLAERVVLDAMERGDGLALRLFPGELKPQCDQLYAIDASELLGLRESGWQLLPHLHFSKRSFRWQAFFYPAVRSSADDYLAFFTEPSLRATRTVGEWRDWFDEAVRGGILNEEDQAKFDEAFADLEADAAFIPLPGIQLLWELDLATAETLDDGRGGLEAVLATEIDRALAALGQPLIEHWE